MPERNKQINRTLQFFYQNPVAAVSLELFLTVGLVLFLAVFAIRPTLLTMSDLLKEIEDKKDLDQKLGQKVAALSTAQSEYLAYQPRLPVLDQAIPKTPAIVNALKIIEKTATEQSLIVSSIAVNELPEEATHSADGKATVLNVPMTITLNGDYLGVRRMVEALKNNRRLFAIDTVVLSASEEQTGKTLRASLTIDVPYIPNDSTL